MLVNKALNISLLSRSSHLLRMSTTNPYCTGAGGASGVPGSGVGKGGGGGGSVREAGGSLGKREAALEEQYFYNLQKQQVENLKDDSKDKKNKEK